MALLLAEPVAATPAYNYLGRAVSGPAIFSGPIYMRAQDCNVDLVGNQAPAGHWWRCVYATSADELLPTANWNYVGTPWLVGCDFSSSGTLVHSYFWYMDNRVTNHRTTLKDVAGSSCSRTEQGGTSLAITYTTPSQIKVNGVSVSQGLRIESTSLVRYNL